MIPCTHWSRDDAKPRRGICAKGVLSPTHQYCMETCKLYEGPFRTVQVRVPATPRGLGDVAALAIKRITGRSSCGACDRRRQWLNWIAPFTPLREVVLRVAVVVLIIIAIIK